MSKVHHELIRLSNIFGCDVLSAEFSHHMDENDQLAIIRDEFRFPKSPAEGKRVLYLCGNSLGLQPKNLQYHVHRQIEKWADEGVEGHFMGETPWLDIDDIVVDSMARLTGAMPSEVVMMNSLTCNLHLMMVAFYRPTSSRYKIIMEKKAFPSDYHVVISQMQINGIDPNEALVEVAPSEGRETLIMEDIERVIRKDGTQTALVLFSGVQYYTGQFFDIKSITALAHEYGCMAGFDLAHAVGNVPLQLHDWGCDFACWCSYKYMNCGPGSIGGCFVHSRHASGKCANSVSSDEHVPPHPLRLAGWWGHRRNDRFDMAPVFHPCEGANGFRVSNPPVLLVACVRASLDVFDKAGIEAIREKSLLLTGYLEYLLKEQLSNVLEIFTPSNPDERGAQLSLSFTAAPLSTTSSKDNSDDQPALDLDKVLAALKGEGIICDARKPNVIRIAPAPLYNSFDDVFSFVQALKNVFCCNK